jgi:hypothetical protein
MTNKKQGRLRFVMQPKQFCTMRHLPGVWEVHFSGLSEVLHYGTLLPFLLEVNLAELINWEVGGNNVKWCIL